MLSKGEIFLGNVKPFRHPYSLDITISSNFKAIFNRIGTASYKSNGVFSFEPVDKLDYFVVQNENNLYFKIGVSGVENNELLFCLSDKSIYFYFRNRLVFVNSSYFQFIQTMAYVDYYVRLIYEKTRECLALVNSMEEILKIKNYYAILRNDLHQIDRKAFAGLHFWPCSLRGLHEQYALYQELEENNPFSPQDEFYNFFLPAELCFDEKSPF